MLLATGAVAAAQTAVGTYAGIALSAGTTNTSTATTSQFNAPVGVARDAAGNVYVADKNNGLIRKIAASGTHAVTTIASSLVNPTGIAVDGQSPVNLYVTTNQTVIKISGANLDTTTVLAGSAGAIGSTPVGANTAGTAARFFNPTGIAVNAAGTIAYVSDTNNHVICRLDIGGTVTVNTVAGTIGTSGSTATTFSFPYGVALNSAGGTLYVADYGNHGIRSVDVAGATPSYAVATVAGTLGTAGFADSPNALFRGPAGVAIDSSGNLYVTDLTSNTLRKIASGSVSTLAGNDGSTGVADGVGSAARFSGPYGIAIDPNSNALYIADSGNQTIRLAGAAAAPSITSQPTASTTLAAGATFTLTVTASGNPTPTYQWRKGGQAIQGATGATFTIPSVSASDAGNYDVVATNSVSSATSNTAALTVTQAPQITNTQTDYATQVGATGNIFTVTASGSPAASFSVTSGSFPTWASLGTTTGIVSVSSNPVPSSDSGTTYTFTVQAANGTAPAATKQFRLTIQNAPIISSAPQDTAVAAGQAASFTVTAAGTPSPTSFTWQRQAGGIGGFFDITPDSTYVVSSGGTTSTLTIYNTTTGMNGDRFQVVVGNGVGTTTSSSAKLTATVAPVFVAPFTTTFVVGQTPTFQIKANGTPNPTYSVISGTFPSWASLDTNTGVISVISAIPTSDGGQTYTFTARATNGGTPVDQQYSIAVSATPLTPTITTQPTAQSVGLNQNATFTVVAAGSPTLTYQWQRYRLGDSDFVNLTDVGQYSGTSTSTLTITSATAEMNQDLFRVVVTNSLGNVTSDTAQLTLTAGNVFSTLAGQAGSRGSDNGTGSAARFSAPTALVLDSQGNAYVSDTANHTIRKITAAGVVTTFAGTPGVAGADDGLGAAARFNSPSGIAIDASNNLYVADSGNHAIRMISPVGYVTTIAGRAGSIGYADGAGTDARFAYPSGVAVDATGFVYVADTLNSKIRKLAPAGGTYTVLPLPLTDASSNPVTLSYPNSIAVDSAYNLYVADTRNNVIRKITPAGVTTTLAGTVGSFGSTDGTGAAARFTLPNGVAVDSSGNLYVADTGNQIVRKVVISSGVVTTIAGSAGQTGSADGSAGTVRFNQPYGVAVDSSGNLYVADTFNHTIRRSGAGVAPQITTGPQAQSIRVGQNATFSVVATGTPTPSYQWQRQAAGTSGFVNIVNDATYSGVNTATLTVTTPTEAMNGDQFQVVVNNLVSPSATSSAATMTVLPAVSAPAITTQPSAATVNRGETATFTVAATGTDPLSYQWKKDGVAIAGATSATLSLANAQATDGALYTVTITNTAGSVTSNPAGLTVNSVPVITVPPRAQVVTSGSAVVFNVTATGGSNLSYQWRKNGTAIAGATSSTLTLASVTGADAGNYDVVVTNSLGSVTSSLAQLTLVTANTTPTFTAQPAPQTAVVGSTITLSAAAAAVPAPSYQWRKNGVAISGATSSTLLLSGVQASDSGNYDVVITNSAGTTTSSAATVRVIARSYAGTYFGSFSGGIGTFALYVRPDNTGAFLGYIPGSTAPVMTLNVSINDNGQFSFTQLGTVSTTVSADEPPRAAALGTITVNAVVGTDGSVTGSLTGGAIATLSATRAPDVGATQNVAGLYLAGATNSAANTVTIVSADGQAYAMVQSGSTTDGGKGTANSSGIVSVATGRSTITEAVNATAGTVTGSSTGTVSGSFVGAGEGTLAKQRLANISSRARVSGGDSVAIAGFVISGTESKPVLIRAVGPTLGSYGVTGALSNPKLDLYRNNVVIATNTGVSTSANAAAIAAAGVQAGAFALKDNADSAILITLPPGAYTAQVSSATTNAGIALVEVYDLSAPTAGQKLVNISTRASVGTGDNALIAGVVVTGSSPKRVLIRAVGPGLTQYGLTGVVAQPVLALKTLDGTVIAQNTAWSTSTDALAISAAAAPVGAFPLVGADSAMIVTLAPGSYSAQVTGSGGTTGIALVEVYELQ